MSGGQTSILTGANAGISRRRFVQILGAGAGTSLAALPFLRRNARAAPIYEWHGQALGAEAQLLLAHDDRRAAARAVSHCLDEIARLERIFSLHLPASELVRLNRVGALRRASHDLRLVLSEAERMSKLSGGAFDITIQPLWRTYARHFEAHPDRNDGPSDEAVQAALSLVDYRDLLVDGANVRLRRSGMAASLNGIAQGYITDRVAELLREAGFDRVLVQTGEIYGLAPKSGGTPWPIGIAGPDAAGTPIMRCRLANAAIATSSGRATVFEASGRFNHLLDPRVGASGGRYASVSVIADRAVMADALSTALSLLPMTAAQDLLASAGGREAIYVFPDGRSRSFSA